MRLNKSFFTRDVLDVAPSLLGKVLVRKFEDGTLYKGIIIDVEAYRGEEDLACHANKGRTKRTEVMYWDGGYMYVYLIYGMYWMLNIVTGKKDSPQAVLIRGLKSLDGGVLVGSGRVGKMLGVDKSFYATAIYDSNKIWIENPTVEKISKKHVSKVKSSKRVGVDYAKEWAEKPWRFFLEE